MPFVTSRFLVLLLCLFLASCATTKNTSPEPEAEVPVTAAADLPKGEGDSIDEHLFVPEPVEPVTDAIAESAPAYDNVWAKVVDDFKLPGCADHEESRVWSRWYADHGAYMARVMKRAQPWIYYIAQELEARDMPGELALLPVVESAYDPFAYSSGMALGTWQFIASTGKQYGLRQDWWYDGRRDVYSSTNAALDYLEHLNKKFDGDWMLALAAHNGGKGRVARAIATAEKNGKPTNYWALQLPRETTKYIPKLIALTAIIAYLQRLGQLEHLSDTDMMRELRLALLFKPRERVNLSGDGVHEQR